MPEPTRVLIVDDEPSIVEAFARMLETHGYTVRTALWGADALHEVRAHPPDAILLDLRMPHMNGVEFLRYLREHEEGRTIPVAVVTGDLFVPDEMFVELNALGATVRYKPVSVDGLVSLIGTLLQPQTSDS